MKKQILILIALTFYFNVNSFGRPRSEKIAKNAYNLQSASSNYQNEIGVIDVDNLYRHTCKLYPFKGYNSNSFYYKFLVRDKIQSIRSKYTSYTSSKWLEAHRAQEKEEESERIRAENSKRNREQVFRGPAQGELVRLSEKMTQGPNIKKEDHGSMIIPVALVAFGGVVLSVYYLSKTLNLYSTLYLILMFNQ